MHCQNSRIPVISSTLFLVVAIALGESCGSSGPSIGGADTGMNIDAAGHQDNAATDSESPDSIGDSSTGEGLTPDSMDATKDHEGDPSNDAESFDGGVDTDGDGVPDQLDCAPLDKSVYPGAPDEPDPSNLDSNCDGIDGVIATAVFVDGTDGDDSGAGSPEDPVATFVAAFELIKADEQRFQLYVAEGVYEEGIVVEDGWELHGGYSGLKSGWKGHSPSAYPTRILAGPVAVTFQDIASWALVDSFLIESPSSLVPGGDSIGVLVNAGGGTVRLARCKIETGIGAKGAAGEDGAIGAEGGDGSNGFEGCSTTGVTCGTPCAQPSGGTGGESNCNETGGQGGDPGFDDGDLVAGTKGGDGGVDGQGGAGGEGAQKENTNGTEGGFGAAGEAGSHGSGGTVSGPVDVAGYHGNAGGHGEPGKPGSGGGGGGGGSGGDNFGECPAWGGGGGGGGAGGCGGQEGTGGQAGGASIGIILLDSHVELDSCVIVTQGGGDGGKGGAGGIGGANGKGGDGGSGTGGFNSSQSGDGGSGGFGGQGGNGGHGGGGAGGHSTGIYCDATGTVGLLNTNVTTGSGGKGGPGGDETLLSGRGEDGLTQNTVNCPP